MQRFILAGLIGLMPAIALATPDAPALPVTGRPGPSVVVVPADHAAQLLKTDAASTRQAIAEMTGHIQTMAYAPRADRVGLAVTSVAARWDSAISSLAAQWDAQTQVAVMSLTDSVNDAIATFPDTGSDLGERPVFHGPIFFGVRVDIDASLPVTGFFGP